MGAITLSVDFRKFYVSYLCHDLLLFKNTNNLITLLNVTFSKSQNESQNKFVMAKLYCSI